MPDRWNNPADENNPLRTEERERVRDELEARLSANGVKLTGSETDEQIVALSNAFELFDSARERAGAVPTFVQFRVFCTVFSLHPRARPRLSRPGLSPDFLDKQRNFLRQPGPFRGTGPDQLYSLRIDTHAFQDRQHYRRGDHRTDLTAGIGAHGVHQ